MVESISIRKLAIMHLCSKCVAVTFLDLFEKAFFQILVISLDGSK